MLLEQGEGRSLEKEGRGGLFWPSGNSEAEMSKKIADLGDWAEVRKSIRVTCIKPVKTMQQGQVFQNIDNWDQRWSCCPRSVSTPLTRPLKVHLLVVENKAVLYLYSVCFCT